MSFPVLKKKKSPCIFGMETSNPNGSKHDNEEKVLKSLLDAFGSVFSLEEIASAFCNAGRNADLAGDILYNMQEGTSSSSTPISNGNVRDEKSSKSSYGEISGNIRHANGKLRAPKLKSRPVSGGTISSVLGKDYVWSKPIHQANVSLMTNKPLKLDSKELPMSELWGEEANLNLSKDDHMHSDMEDFLFKMLGDGFQLSRDVIREVLDHCGYDMSKSMQKLLDQSTEALGKMNGSTEKIRDMRPNSEGSSNLRKLQHTNSSSGVSNTNSGEIPTQQKERIDLQKEVLAALFRAPDIPEEFPRRSARTVRRSVVASGQVVTEPPRDSSPEHIAVHLRPEYRDDEDEDEQGGYHALRRAMKEYQGTMKEYYKAAVEAFANGDRDRASNLLEKGNFFLKKAREADEQSNEKIFETRKSADTEDEILLDLHDHGAKEGIRLLKYHLSSFAGIPSIKYLKVIIETNDKDISKGARRRLVMKLLEKESLKWTEEANPRTILIRLDNINREHLSFATK